MFREGDFYAYEDSQSLVIKVTDGKDARSSVAGPTSRRLLLASLDGRVQAELCAPTAAHPA